MACTNAEILEQWLNGNKTFVRSQLKGITPLRTLELVELYYVNEQNFPQAIREVKQMIG